MSLNTQLKTRTPVDLPRVGRHPHRPTNFAEMSSYRSGPHVIVGACITGRSVLACMSLTMPCDDHTHSCESRASVYLVANPFLRQSLAAADFVLGIMTA
jgi:hypothetical protein